MRPNILFVNLISLPSEYIQESVAGKSAASDTWYMPLHMPLGILYLSSYVKVWNDVGEVSLLDCPLCLRNLSGYSNIQEFFVEEARKRVRFRPDILAFSLNFSSSHTFFQLAVKALKTLWPTAKTIVGGIHATNSTEILLSQKDIDYVLRGEGEVAFSEMIRQLTQNQPMNVKGLYSKAATQQAGTLSLADPVENLDNLPFPDWELLDINNYVHARGDRRGRYDARSHYIAPIMTTRGCPFRCTYCSAHTVHGRKVRYRSIKNVIQEIRTLHDLYGVTLFDIQDDLFTANKNRVLSLLDAIENQGIPDIELMFPNGLHVSTLDEEILDRLIKAGAKVVNLAIESGSEYVQKHIINKNCNLQKARDLVWLCRKRNLIVRCFFIFGFPGETKALMNETVQYMRNLDADWYVINIAMPLIGSEMYEQFLQKEYFKKGDVEIWSKEFFQERSFDTEEISASELKDFVYRLNLDLNFVNNASIRHRNFDQAISIFKDIIVTYPFHLFAWHGLYLAYKGKKDITKAREIRVKMRELIANDKLSADMYAKYGDLLSEQGLTDD